jgi:hypothetical protein
MQSNHYKEYNDWIALNQNGRCKMADVNKPKSIFNDFEAELIKYLSSEYSHLVNIPAIKKRTFSKFINRTKFLYTSTIYPNQKIKLKKVLLGLKSFQNQKYANFPFTFI